MRMHVGVTFGCVLLGLAMPLSVVGITKGGDCPRLTLDLSANVLPGERAWADLPIDAGACMKGLISFDIAVSDPAAVARYACYVRSGKGWYMTSFEPTTDEVRPERAYSVALSTAEFAEIQGRPEGWRKGDLVRFAVYQEPSALGGARAPNPSVVTISNIAFKAVGSAVLFIRNSRQKEKDAEYVSMMRRSFDALGIPTRALDQDDLAQGGLDGAKLVVIARAPMLSEPCVAALEAFVAKGGKVMAAFQVPEQVARLVGVRQKGPVCPEKQGLPAFAGLEKGSFQLDGQPVFVPQNPWQCERVEALAGAKIMAWWRTADGRVTDVPGLVVAPHGIYISHLWRGEPRDESLALFAAAVETVLPGTLARLAKAKSAAKARRSDARKLLAAMPGKSGERRFIWCHSAWGLGQEHDWDSSCRLAKENGFTDLLVNLAWGGCAFYSSKILPRSKIGLRGDALEECRAACRKHGLRMHVWKVCWRAGAGAPASFAAKQVKKGRVCVAVDGEVCPQWNCPSDPANQRLEINAMTELALVKGVDGIHFDYIRYRNENFCFCDGCRRRFEENVGHKVAKWPQDARRGGILFDDWNRFRCENIAGVVKAVAKNVKKVRPEVEISAAVLPVPASAGIGKGQDWLAWCREGWLDFVCPMDYYDRPTRFATCIRAQRDAMKGLRTKLYPGVALECSRFGCIDMLVIAQEIAEVRKAGLDGFSAFHLGQYAESVLPELRRGPLKEMAK